MDVSEESKTTKITWGMLIGSLVTFANLYGPQTFIQHFTQDFHMSASEASLALSISTFTLAFGMLVMAAVSNTWGRKNIMVFSLVSSSVIYLLVGFAPNFEVLLILRAIEGFATAGFPAIAVTYLAEELSGNQFPKSLAVYITGSGFGGFLGRIVSSSVLDLSNWHVAVFVLGTLTMILSIVFIFLVEPSKHFVSQEFSFKNWISGIIAACKDTKLWYFYGLGFLALGVYVAMFNYIGFPLIKDFGLSQTLVGFIFIFQLMGSIGSMTVGKLSDRYSRAQMLCASLIIALIGICLTAVHFLPVALAGLFILSCGFFAWHNIVSGWVSNSAIPTAKAYASSLYLLFYYIGSSVIGTIGGHFYDANGWNGVTGIMITCCIVGLILLGLVEIKLKKMTKHATI
ncbi:MFS transporter [Rummeliibacillus pycnus]|jgi:YNFM family putative membrane transporter|uniref:MFS transporter n=1 Tax=Rummeliibacillus pycnus TaxID=101070 RepID=UPI000C9BE6AB|nr:MFS transporter [Rummeliibacillus pycnus]